MEALNDDTSAPQTDRKRNRRLDEMRFMVTVKTSLNKEVLSLLFGCFNLLNELYLIPLKGLDAVEMS